MVPIAATGAARARYVFCNIPGWRGPKVSGVVLPRFVNGQKPGRAIPGSGCTGPAVSILRRVDSAASGSECFTAIGVLKIRAASDRTYGKSHSATFFDGDCRTRRRIKDTRCAKANCDRCARAVNECDLVTTACISVFRIRSVTTDIYIMVNYLFNRHFSCSLDLLFLNVGRIKDFECQSC